MITEQVADERPLPQRAEQMLPDTVAVRSKATELEQQSHALIRHRPVVALLVAAGAGYLVGRLVSRGMR